MIIWFPLMSYRAGNRLYRRLHGVPIERVSALNPGLKRRPLDLRKPVKRKWKTT